MDIKKLLIGMDAVSASRICTENGTNIAFSKVDGKDTNVDKEWDKYVYVEVETKIIDGKTVYMVTG